MRAAVVVVCLVGMAGAARADEPSGSAAIAGSDAAGSAAFAGSAASPNPWTDLSLSAESPLATAPIARHRYHPLAAGLTVGGMYAAIFGWMYFAWYFHESDLSHYKFGGDDENCDPLHGAAEARCIIFGWAGDTTYAGGEDKFGHAWATMALARLTDEILEQLGGFSHTKSMWIGTTLSWLTFLGVEVRDGVNFEFSFSDLGGDTVGALVGLALMHWPRLDELFDYRVQYFPSRMYMRKLDGSSPCARGGCSRWDFAEDYSGETFLLAFHLGAIQHLRDLEHVGFLFRFVDIAASFDTRNYKPDPDIINGQPLGGRPVQQLGIGISFNAQGFFDWLLERGEHQTLRKVTHGLGEVFNLPYTYGGLPVHNHSPCPTCTPSNDGAL